MPSSEMNMDLNAELKSPLQLILQPFSAAELSIFPLTQL